MNLSEANALRSRLTSDVDLDRVALLAGLRAGDAGQPVAAAVGKVFFDAADVDFFDGSQGNILAAEAVRYAIAEHLKKHLSEYSILKQPVDAQKQMEVLAGKSGNQITPLAEGPGLSDLLPNIGEIWSPVKWIWLVVSGLVIAIFLFWFAGRKTDQAISSVSEPRVSVAREPKKKGRPKKEKKALTA